MCLYSVSQRICQAACFLYLSLEKHSKPKQKSSNRVGCYVFLSAQSSMFHLNGTLEVDSFNCYSHVKLPDFMHQFWFILVH